MLTHPDRNRDKWIRTMAEPRPTRDIGQTTLLVPAAVAGKRSRKPP